MKKSKIMLFILVLMTSLISSCQTSRTSRVSQTQIQLVQYVLKKEDLPGFGWSDTGGSWESDDSGESYGVVYISTVDKYIFISHK